MTESEPLEAQLPECWMMELPVCSSTNHYVERADAESNKMHFRRVVRLPDGSCGCDGSIWEFGLPSVQRISALHGISLTPSSKPMPFEGVSSMPI